jgi:hypothetical protein
MKHVLRTAAFGLLVVAKVAIAQITGTGTTGTVPQFTGASAIGNSPIAIDTPNTSVNIGNIYAFQQYLNVYSGTLRLETAATNGGMYITSGQANPSYHTIGYRFGQDSAIAQRGMLYDQQSGRVSLINTNATGAALGTTISERLTVLPNGFVGVGTVTPSTAMEVNGSIKMTSGSAGTMTFADGTVQSTAWTGVLCGGDYAESVGVTGNRSQYEPGDVMVVDPSSSGQFLKSVEPYSTLVAGIYATKPGVIGRRTTDPEKAKEEIPMAMVGIVPTKVSAENGAVKPGDLLVTSSTPGYVMKGTDRERLTGAVVGKALGTVDAGMATIEVLVSLQ